MVYKSLQASRAAAALAVVLFHLGAQLALGKTFGLAWFGDAFRFGRAGVDFFFVLSGFIIVTAHRNDFFQPGRLVRYIRKRITRIYPVYWVIFVVVFCLAMAVPATRAALPHDPALIAKSLALLPLDHHIVGGTGAPVIVTAWSLQYELVFYAIVGLFIWSRTMAALAMLALLANALMCVDACTFPASFFASPYFLLFGLGAAVALARPAFRLPGRPLLLAGLGGLAFALTAVVETLTLAPLGSHMSLLAYGLSSAMLIYGLVEAENIGQTVGGYRFVQLLGDASYSLYLLHFPVLSMLFKIALAAGLRGTAGACATFVLVLAGCVTSGLLFHLWIERPLLRLLSSSNRAASAPVAADAEVKM